MCVAGGRQQRVTSGNTTSSIWRKTHLLSGMDIDCEQMYPHPTLYIMHSSILQFSVTLHCTLLFGSLTMGGLKSPASGSVDQRSIQLNHTA